MAAGGLTHKIGIVAVGRAASTLSIFVVYAILARAWAPDAVGVYLAIWVLGNTLVPAFLLGLPSSLLYFFPRRYPADRGYLILQTILCLSVSGLLLVGLLFLLGPQLARWLELAALAALDELRAYLLPFLPYIFSLVAGGFVESTLVAAERPQWQAGLALGTGAGLIAAAGAGAGLDLGIKDVFLLFSGVGVLRLGTALFLVGRAVGMKSASGERWAGLGEYLQYSWPIGLSDGVGSLSRSVDRFVVLSFFAADTFAHYHLGAIEVPVNLLLAAVVAVLVPEVSRLYKEGCLEEIGRLSLVVLPLFFFLFFFAESVIVVYLTESYARTRWVFRIFLLALPLRCAIYNPLLVGMGKARWTLWSSAGDLLLNLSLSVVLVRVMLGQRPEWAFLGPAAATVAATYVQVFFLVGLIARHLQWGVRQLLPWGRLLRVGSFSCGTALVGLWTAGWVDVHLAKLALGGGVFGLLLAGLLWRSPQDREELRRVFQGLVKS